MRAAEPTCPAPCNTYGGRDNMGVRRYGRRTKADMRYVWKGKAAARPTLR